MNGRRISVDEDDRRRIFLQHVVDGTAFCPQISAATDDHLDDGHRQTQNSAGLNHRQITKSAAVDVNDFVIQL
jgi:hypothetical protein